jgi:hypothetical protein
MKTLLNTIRATTLEELIAEGIELISIDGSAILPFSEISFSDDDMGMVLIEGETEFFWHTPKNCTQRIIVYLKGWDK